MANETTNNYKRTIAGSVGAGVGAIFNGSGRTYYILEHKTSSQYHQAGESQKIIIDQIELGRDPSCQVRFDAETVSRKHAAIVREGQNWQLIHLSQSNPTFVNGRPIQGHYYLQSGDEIQLSANGPRLGFIVPQGKKALTSSIKLTERMNLFRKQALAPYRVAITILSALLAVAFIALIGFGIWTFMLNNDLREQKEQALALQKQINSYDEQIAEWEAIAEKTPELEQQIAELKNKKAQVVTNWRTIVKEVEKKDPEEAQKIVEEAKSVINESDVIDPIDEKEEKSKLDVMDETIDHKDANATIRDYYDQIYTLKISKITIERDGHAFDPGIAVSDVICGTGFVLSNGTFVTARQNIEPWVYEGTLKGPWRTLMAEYVALGCDVVIEYDAYSTEGTGHKLHFSNKDFKINRTGDTETLTIDISRDVRVRLKDNGIAVNVYETRKAEFAVFSKKSYSYALLPGVGGAGIPYHAGMSQSIEGGSEITIAGFKNHTNIHNLKDNISYFSSKTSRADNRNGTIVLQDANSNSGYLGSPAFVKDDKGKFYVIGVMVGSLFGEDRLVPIYMCN